MASWLGEIKRRKVFQVAAAYLVVAWLLVQVITAVEAPLRLPEWFDTAVIVLVAIGVPITISTTRGTARGAGIASSCQLALERSRAGLRGGLQPQFERHRCPPGLCNTQTRCG